MEYWAVSYSSDSIKHYGVLGMRWGVRHDPQKAYTKATNKLMKLERKANKNADKASDRLKYKIARAEKRATRFKLKEAKTKRAATRLLFPMNPEKASKRIMKYQIKAARAENRAARRLKKYEKFKMRGERYNKRSEKWLQKMNKAFADVPASKLNDADVARVNDYISRHGEKNRWNRY